MPTPSEEDSQVPSDLPGLVATIMDFLCQAARRKNVKGMFAEGGQPQEMMDKALDSAMAYAQMTTDDVSVALIWMIAHADTLRTRRRTLGLRTPMPSSLTRTMR